MKKPPADYKTRARNKAEQLNDGIWFKSVEGDNRVRILPTPEIEDKRGNVISEGVWMEYDIHRNVGPHKKVVRCGKDAITSEGACWLCDSMIPKLLDRGKTKTADEIAPERQMLVQIAKVKENEEGEILGFNGPKLWNPSKGQVKDLIQTYLVSKRRDYVHPKEGYNLSYSRKGSGLATRYTPIQADEESSRVPSAIINKLKPFNAVKEIPVYSEARQKAAYAGVDYDEKGDRDMAKKRRDEDDEDVKKKSKSKKVVEDEDDDEDEDFDLDEEDTDDDDEDEDEDEKPVKKGKSAPPAKKKKKVVEEDDDDEDEEEESDDYEEDDDDEDEKPVKKGKASKSAKKSKSKKDDDDDDEDEEEEESDDDDEDEDEDEKPVKKGKSAPPAKKKKKVVEEDDDDEDEEEEESDDDDDEEEEEEKPAKKGKVAKKAGKPRKKWPTD